MRDQRTLLVERRRISKERLRGRIRHRFIHVGIKVFACFGRRDINFDAQSLLLVIQPVSFNAEKELVFKRVRRHSKVRSDVSSIGRPLIRNAAFEAGEATPIIRYGTVVGDAGISAYKGSTRHVGIAPVGIKGGYGVTARRKTNRRRQLPVAKTGVIEWLVP